MPGDPGAAPDDHHSPSTASYATRTVRYVIQTLLVTVWLLRRQEPTTSVRAPPDSRADPPHVNGLRRAMSAHRERTVPTRCSVSVAALRTARSQPPGGTSAVDRVTVEGRKSGLRNATSTVSASGSRPDSAASARAFTHMPCAIARLNPNAFADSPDRWIGFTSPDTFA